MTNSRGILITGRLLFAEKVILPGVGFEEATRFAAIRINRADVLSFDFKPSKPPSFGAVLDPDLLYAASLRVVGKEANFHFAAAFCAARGIWLHVRPLYVNA
jgi:hypothetical protein